MCAFTRACVCVCVCLCVRVCARVSPFCHLFFLFACVSIWPFACLINCLSVCLSDCLFDCLFACLFVQAALDEGKSIGPCSHPAFAVGTLGYSTGTHGVLKRTHGYSTGTPEVLRASRVPQALTSTGPSALG